MEDGVVDAPAPEGELPEDPALNSAVRGEQVQGQGPGPGAHEGDGLVQGVHREHRQDGPENLLLHDRVLRGYAVQHRGGDAQPLRVTAAPHNHLLPVQEGGQSHKVLLVYDLSITWILQRVRAIHAADFTDDFRQEFFLYRLGHQHIVRGHTGLPAVEEFPKDDPPGGHGQVGGLVHHAGALAPQLQGDGGEMGGRLGHHLPAHGHAAGEEDVVEGL